MAYVKHIVRTGTIPDAGACWTCYHPPLYYLANAPVHAAGQALFGQPERAMQWFSVLLSCLTLALGVAVLLKTMRGAPLAVACLLWCLWPVLFLVAPRIGNDQLFYVAHLGALHGQLAGQYDGNELTGVLGIDKLFNFKLTSATKRARHIISFLHIILLFPALYQSSHIQVLHCL